MDNLEPITRNEMFLNGDDLEPITREEMILAGADLEPITRHEWFLKKYRGGGGGGGYDLVNIPNLPADIASFNDGTDLPMASLKVAVTPYQDLHGYDAPWAGGAGKNKFDADTVYATFKQADGSFVGLSGHINSIETPIPANLVGHQITFSAYLQIPSGSTVTSLRVAARVNGVVLSGEFISSETYTISSVTFTPESTEDIVKISYGSNGNQSMQFKNIQLEEGSTATSFAPYSNICPIIGWDEAVVTVADDAESPTTSHEYTIDLDGTRYGGKVDLVNGVMDDTLDHIASYNGEALPSTWISDRDVYAEGTTPTIGAEVVYTRATPITVQLAPTPVKSLEGENNIFANCGQITEVKYFKKA